MKVETFPSIKIKNNDLDFNNSHNNSGYVEAVFSHGSIVLKTASSKSSAISAKDLKKVLK